MSLKDHLEKIPYFVTIAKLGSFQAAAQALFITQPSLSKSIKILEDTVGKPLFIRHPKGVRLTIEGEILFRESKNMLQLLEQTSQKIKNPTDPLKYSIRIGTYDSILIYFWADFLRSFSKKYPQLKFEIKTMRSHEAQRALENNELDVALIISPTASKNYKQIDLQSDKFYFYESTSKNKLYRNNTQAPLIFMDQSLKEIKSDLDSLSEYLLKKESPERQIFSLSSLESVKELCLSGLGIGVLPSFVAAKELSAKRLKRVSVTNEYYDLGFGEHKISLIYNPVWENSATFQDLAKEILKHKWR